MRTLPNALKPRETPSQLPLISVVTCSFQQGRYLEQALRSVLDQGYPRLEYIVIDGGSTDDSVNIIKRHQSALAYWISQPDRGQADALIKGFARASGDICGWLCSDDLLLPGALHAVGAYFSANPEACAVYGDALWIDAEGRLLRPKKEMGFNRFVLLHDHNYIPQPSMFWRRSLYEAVAGLDPQFDLAMDADLWERFSARTRIAHMSRYLSCMRFYPQQKTRSRRVQGRREDGAIRQRDETWAARALTAGALQIMARCLRVSAKAVAGGYTARVPKEQRAWLEQCAAEGARK
jgi:glycosyltransferase involved in cell wall biosynthesis